MPVKWTSETHEQLLLLLLNKVKVDRADLAEWWTGTFGHSKGETMTPRAIKEHMPFLGKKFGQASGYPHGTPNKNSRPSKAANSSDSAKNAGRVSDSRKRRPEDEFEDEYDSELGIDDTLVTPRATISGSAKSASKKIKLKNQEDLQEVSFEDFVTAQGCGKRSSSDSKPSAFTRRLVLEPSESDISEFIPGKKSK